MNAIQIPKPCAENWANMTPTERGAFCASCAKEVIDFTTQNLHEIKSSIKEMKSSEICGRISIGQLEDLNFDYMNWEKSQQWDNQQKMFFAFVFVFVLSLTSCSTEPKRTELSVEQGEAKHMFDAETSQIKDRQTITVERKKDFELLAKELETTALIEPDTISKHSSDNRLSKEELTNVCRRDYITVGAIVHYGKFDEYLEDVLPAERRDSLGRLIPEKFSSIVYPNPSPGLSKLKIELPQNSNLTIALFDLSGNYIETLSDHELFDAGVHELDLDISDQLPGTYLVSILSETYKASLKLIKL